MNEDKTNKKLIDDLKKILPRLMPQKTLKQNFGEK